MDLISADEVIRRVELFLKRGESIKPTPGIHFEPTALPPVGAIETEPLTEQTALRRLDAFLGRIPSRSATYCGRGIVICAGGAKYFTNAWVCIRMLRRHGCQMPIQLWHLGPEECDSRMRELLRPFEVECVDGTEVRRRIPVRILNGWEIKAYAILHSPFQEVLLLDSDNVPLVDPEFLFETPEYAETGAIFWPDFSRLDPTRSIWNLCGIAYRDEPEFESGQLVVDKQRCWRALQITMWLNEHSDFFYKHIHGDKETFHMGFRKASKSYAMPLTPIHPLPGVMCQHDFSGRRIFQHRNLAKWTLSGQNPRIADFLFEEECLEYLEQLRVLWDGQICARPFELPANAQASVLAQELQAHEFLYRRVGFDKRRMSFLPNGLVGVGEARCERFWSFLERDGELVLQLSSDTDITCELKRATNGNWKGRWLLYEQMAVELVPLANGHGCAETLQVNRTDA